MPKTLYLIHHTHTDIGYTETQGRIGRWQVDFIRQALAIARARPGFVWQCETFWAVERFWEQADEDERAELLDAIGRGAIGLSATYLHFNELIGDAVLRAVTARAARLGPPVRSAMSADINGFSWGYAQALVDAGVESLFTCVHTHHGMYPLGETQVPFCWETPKGDRLLVWNGEHYHLGNELGLVPGAVSSYLTKDECDEGMIFHDAWGVAEIRIPRYFAQLEARGYAYDFVPVMASGLRTDNAPPNAAILDQIARWNETYGETIRVEMATLDGFFGRVSKEGLPVLRGDWPDWWSDGAAATPAAVKLFRQAQRDYELSLQIGQEPDEDLETNLALFAEHTFSHSDAMASPWFPLVASIDARKVAYAALAAEAAQARVDASVLRPDLPLRYTVRNPHPVLLADVARLEVSHFEFHELDLDKGFAVGDEPCELRFVPRGAEICVPLALGPGEERVLEITPGPARETREVEPPRWVCHPERPFRPVHEITPVASRDEICTVRGAMVLNRKGPDAVRTAGRVIASRSTQGDVFTTERTEYDLPGAGPCETEFLHHRHAPRIDVAFRLHKKSAWEPENLYLALPFDGDVLLDKTGATVRPGVDQLPGTLTDFYAVQAGLAFSGGVAVAMPDNHLVQLGPLDHGERRLMGEPLPPRHAYAWLMTNYWETNFNADLGGFYEFRFHVALDAGIDWCRAANAGFLVTRG